MPNRTHNNLKLRAYGALILATAIWGGALPIIKITEQYIPVFTFLFLRFLLVCILMLPVMIVELKKTPIATKDIKNLVILGLLGQTALAFVFVGVKYTTSLDAAILGTSAPIMVIAAGHFFYNEKLNYKAKLGVFIATLGTLLIMLEPMLFKGQHAELEQGLRVLGNLAVLIYNVAFTAYIIVSKHVMGENSSTLTTILKRLRLNRMTRSYSPTLHTGFTFYVSLVSIFPLMLIENRYMKAFDLTNLTIIPIAGILYMAILSSIVAYVAFEWGLKRAKAADTAIFSYLGPLFTIPISFVLLQESPTPAAFLGIIIIVIGVVGAETNRK